MYVPRHSSTSAAHHSPEHGQGLQSQTPNVAAPYVRDPDGAAMPTVPVAATPATYVSEEGRQIVAANRQALINCAHGEGLRRPVLRVLDDYYSSVLRYCPNQTRTQLQELTKFMDETQRFGYTQQHAALESAQNRFNMGVKGPTSDLAILKGLNGYLSSTDGMFLKQMKRDLNIPWNSDAMRVLYGAMKSHAQAGGRIRDAQFARPHEFLLQLNRSYVQGEDARYAVEVMLSKPAGYVEEFDDDGGVKVWHDPAAQAAAQPRSPLLPAIDRAECQPLLNELKRSWDAMEAAVSGESFKRPALETPDLPQPSAHASGERVSTRASTDQARLPAAVDPNDVTGSWMQADIQGIASGAAATYDAVTLPPDGNPAQSPPSPLVEPLPALSDTVTTPVASQHPMTGYDALPEEMKIPWLVDYLKAPPYPGDVLDVPGSFWLTWP